MNKLLLFLTMCIIPGFMAAVGSILGNAFGKTGLFIGAVIGGLIGVTAATRISLWRGWITSERAPAVQVAGLLGFIIAAIVAGTNLWTPLIPVASTWIIGGMAVLASRAKSNTELHKM